MRSVLYVVAFWNIAVLVLYGIDKWKSTHNKRRIKESTLLVPAFFMGGAGAILGMYIFRHKTKHLKFKILLPISLLLNMAVCMGVFYLLKGTG